MKKNSVFAAFIFGACFILYAKTISFEFSYFDDDQILITNRSYFEAKDVVKMLTSDAFLLKQTSYYRPIQSISYLADTIISGGLHPWMFHLTNILLFGFIGCFLFLILLQFHIPSKAAFIGTLIFSVHPLFVTAVAWIPARGDLLLTLFCLLSMISFIKYRQKGEIKFLILTWISFTLALFCKETAAVLPFLFLIYFLTFVPTRKMTKNHLLLFFALLFSGFIWLYLRIIYTSSLIEQITIQNVLLNFLSIPAAFSQLIVFPIDFSPMPNFTATKIVLGLLVIAFLWYICKKRILQIRLMHLFGVIWFLLLLLPNFMGKTSNFVFDYIDHRFLLPMAGIVLFILSLFPISVPKEEESGTYKSKDLIWIGVVAALAIVSFFKTDVYKNSDSFYGAIIHFNRETAYAYNSRGVIRFAKEDLTHAMEDFNQAIQLDTAYIQAYHNRGTLKFGLGDLTGAMDDLNRAIMLDPDYAEAYVDRAITKGMMGNVYAALDDINKALAIKPELKEAYFNRAIAYYQLNDFEKALSDIERVLEIVPGNEQAIELKNQILTQSNLFVP